VLSPSRIIVQWSQTKSTRAQPFRASTWTEIVGDDPRRLNPLLEHLQSLRPTDPVTRLSTAQLVRLLLGRSHDSKVAGPEDDHLPLHTRCVNTIDLEQIKARLQPSAVKHLEHLFSLLKRNDEVKPARGGHLSPSDADQLVADGILEPVAVEAAPACGWCTPFCVVEQRGDKLRRRFILWTESQNESVYRAGFESQVDLHHVSQYLDAVRHDTAATFDLSPS
jgi:hypothetical protein